MLKQSVIEVIDEATPQIKTINDKRIELAENRINSEEYKIIEDKKLRTESDTITQQVISEIRVIADKEIESLNASVNPNSDMTTSNILKSLILLKRL